MRPTFGCGLRQFLMEPNTVATRAADPARGRPRARGVGAADRRQGGDGRPPGDDPALVLLTIRYEHRQRRPPGPARLPVLPGSEGAMPLPHPDPRRPVLRPAARRAGRPHPRLRAGVDRPPPERSGHHADRAVRVPRREPALPVQPDPRRDAARVPRPARHPAAAGGAGDRHRRGDDPPRTGPRAGPARTRRCSQARPRSPRSDEVQRVARGGAGGDPRPGHDAERTRTPLEYLGPGERGGRRHRSRTSSPYRTVVRGSRPEQAGWRRARPFGDVDRRHRLYRDRWPRRSRRCGRPATALAGGRLSIGVVPAEDVADDRDPERCRVRAPGARLLHRLRRWSGRSVHRARRDGR